MSEQKIAGYRELTDEEIQYVNMIKEKEADLENTVDILGKFPDIDPRWLAIGRTDIQKGLMALTRAVTRPTSL